jgi:Lrp/AsnC family leucine-responsive transcriptional regulator
LAEIMLDAVDHRIVKVLQQDGRITNQDLSERVGLSPSPCLRRLRNWKSRA